MRMARSRYAGSRYFSQVSAGSRTWPSESTTSALAEVVIAVSLQAKRRHGNAAPCYALILFVPSTEGQPDRMALDSWEIRRQRMAWSSRAAGRGSRSTYLPDHT